MYLNGTEVFRSNMPDGTIDYQTSASTNVFGSDETALYSATINPALLVAGTNVLAVEIHQSSSDSPDISFDLGLVGTHIVTPGVVSSLRLVSFPSPVQAGVAGNLTVTAVDGSGATVAGYRGTIHFTSSDTQATLPPDYTFTAADNGTHTFSANLKSAGSQSIIATDTATGTIAGAQSVTVQPNVASILRVAGFPTSIQAGMAGNFTVTALDEFGNTATSYQGTIHFTSSDSQATQPADYTFTAADNGSLTFSATLKTAGSQTLTAADFVTTSISGTQTIAVQPAAASALRVAGFSSPTQAGIAGTFTVTAIDAFGNTATGYLNTIYFTSSDSQAVLPANYTFTTADNDTHTFSAMLKTAGSQSLVATDTVTSTVAGSQTVTVQPAAASSARVSGFPSPIQAGVAGTFTVTILDAYGNVATGYRGTIHFSSNDGQAILPANYIFTAADSGTHTFSATLKTAGSQSLVATDTVTSTVAGSQTVTVQPAAASSARVSGFPSPIQAGVAGTFTVTILDAYGNVATGYRGTIRFSSNDGQAILPANYIFTSADSGVHTFSATLKTAGNQSLIATDADTSSIAGTQSVTVQPAAASSVRLSGFPSPVQAGVAGNFAATILDGYGNVATGYRGTIRFSSSDSQAILPTNYTFTAADNGAHSFSATLKTAGSRSLTATDTVSGSITGSQTITVQPATASTARVSGFPSLIQAGGAGNFTVTLLDVFGNTATGYRGTIRFSSSDSQAILPANYIFSSADSGVHTFSATLKTAGSKLITATDTITSSITGNQTITVQPAAASNARVSGFPSPIQAGVAGNFTVTILDAFGNTVTGYRGTIHFTSSDTQAVLPANYAFTAADGGVRTFSATLKTAGTKLITATDTVSSSITGSQTITVQPAAAKSARMSGFPSPIQAGVAGNFTVTLLDAYGNVATGYRGTIHFSSNDGQAILPANYIFTSADSGVHTFSATLKTAGSRSLAATDTVTSSITSSQSISVQAAAASSLRVAGFPSSVKAGSTKSFTVTVVDAYGNIATGYRGTIHFTSTDSRAVLPANYAFTAADNGVHTFSATLKTTGMQSLIATDTVTSSITGKQTITVT